MGLGFLVMEPACRRLVLLMSNFSDRALLKILLFTMPTGWFDVSCEIALHKGGIVLKRKQPVQEKAVSDPLYSLSANKSLCQIKV